MGEPVPDQRMNALVEQKYLQRAAGRRVPFLDRLDIQPDVLNYHDAASLNFYAYA